MSIFGRKRLEHSTANSSEIIASAEFDLRSGRDWGQLRSVVSVDRGVSARSWKWYSEIGEINYGVSRGAKLAGYAKITARKLNKDGTPGELAPASSPAAQIAARLSSPYGGQRGLLDRFFVLMKVPGSAYLIRCRDEDGDVCGYDVIDADEIQRASTEATDRERNEPLKRILLPNSVAGSNGDTLTEDIRPEDFLGRIWRPAGRFVELPTSPLRALDTECELLHLLTIGLKAKLTSRMALNGIFYVPNEIKDITSGMPQGKENEAVANNPVLDRLIKAATWAVLNHDQPQAAVPIFMSGPGVNGEQIRHIVMDQEIYGTDMQLRAELIDRILTGLDVQKQQTKGDGSSNHWNASSETDDELRVNIQPDIETWCWAATRMILYREMAEMGIGAKTIMSYCLWYDLTDAKPAINPAEDSRQARDRILVSEASSRRASGFSDDDAPDEIDRIRAVGVKLGDPYLALYGLAEAKNIDWEKVSIQPKPGPEGNPSVPSKGTGPTPEANKPPRLRPA